MSETPLYSRYSLLVTLHEDLRMPSSGYFDIADVVSDIAHHLQVYGRPLTAEAITKITRELRDWDLAPVKPWTHYAGDAEITVRLTQRFTSANPGP